MTSTCTCTCCPWHVAIAACKLKYSLHWKILQNKQKLRETWKFTYNKRLKHPRLWYANEHLTWKRLSTFRNQSCDFVSPWSGNLIASLTPLRVLRVTLVVTWTTQYNTASKLFLQNLLNIPHGAASYFQQKYVYFRIFVRLRQRYLGSGKHLHFAQLVLFPFQNPRLQNGGELVNPASGGQIYL